MFLQAVLGFVDAFDPSDASAPASAMAIATLLHDLWVFTDSGQKLAEPSNAYLDAITARALMTLCVLHDAM